MFGVGRRLFDLWKARTPQFSPGAEYELVDEFAEILNLEGWYHWAPADQVQSTEGDLGPEGPTNKELLEQKEMATVMYLLGAIQRFEGMDSDRVRDIAFEIALLGRSGLDYSDSGKKYTLRSLPGERFSGLQLMALMYVGFKRIDPSLDLQMPFEDAYRTASRLHQGE